MYQCDFRGEFARDDSCRLKPSTQLLNLYLFSRIRDNMSYHIRSSGNRSKSEALVEPLSHIRIKGIIASNPSVYCLPTKLASSLYKRVLLQYEFEHWTWGRQVRNNSNDKAQNKSNLQFFGKQH